MVKRIESIDLLRGVIMVIMALDHVRDFFHFDAFVHSPTDLETTSPGLFFTRFITNYCAPTFIFLAGTSAYLYGVGKTKKELFRFLFTRGIWLIFAEIFIVNLLWSFDLSFKGVYLQVIWAIGVCMIILSLLIYFPKAILLILGLLIVFGHNLLDGIKIEGNGFSSALWSMLHVQNGIKVTENFTIVFIYPVLPWLGVMILGYCFGILYNKSFDPQLRKKWLLGLGLGALTLFILIRGWNNYGDMEHWSTQKNGLFTFLSFINVSKYPPSLDFVLITLGPGFLFLYAFETVKNRITDFFLIFGRVPFFYYILHILFIHSFAVLFDKLFGKDGYSLGIVYLVWIGIVLFLYPFCKLFMEFKTSNRDKWWLSYL